MSLAVLDYTVTLILSCHYHNPPSPLLSPPYPTLPPPMSPSSSAPPVPITALGPVPLGTALPPDIAAILDK